MNSMGKGWPAVWFCLALLVLSFQPSFAMPQYGGAQAIVTGQSQPVGIAVGGNGALYWVNWGSGQLLTLAPSSSTPTVLLSGLSNPQGVGLDAAGNIYVSQYFEGNIIELKAGTSSPVVLVSGLSYPNYLYVTPAGDVYFVTGQTCGTAIEEYNHSTAAVTTIVNVTNAAYPIGGLSVDSQGDLFYARCDNATVNEIPAGSSTSQVLASVPHTYGDQSSQVGGIAVDSAGDVVFCGYQTNVWILAKGSSTPSSISAVSGSSCDQLALDSYGNIYYTDNIGGNIWKMPASTTAQSPVPSLRSSSWNYQVSNSVSCSLSNVSAGDVLFAVLESTGTQQSTMTASDTASDTYSYASNWPIYGIGAAYTQASSSGTVSIALTVGASTGGLAVFCYDISGVRPAISYSYSQGTYSGGYSLGTSLSVTPFSIAQNSFVVAEYTACCNQSGSVPTSFTAGPQFALSPGTPVYGLDEGVVGSEYGTLESSSTGCPMTGTYQGSGQYWYSGGCFAFAPVSPSPRMDSVTASVSPQTVSGAGSLTISGNVAAASGTASNTAVVVTIENPTGAIVGTASAAVVGTGATGTYSTSFVTGGTSSWVGGEYSVTATYGTLNGQAPAVATASFFYASNAISTTTLSVSASPIQTTVGSFSGVQVGYTNTYSQSMSAFVWVIVKNAGGQTIGIFVGSMNMNSGQTVTAFVPTFNLASGTYTATVFATTTGFVAISVASSVTLSL